MTDPVAGLREMARVTREDGVVAACVWDHAGGRGPLSLFWQAARELDPDVEDESQLAGAREGHLGRLFASSRTARDRREHALGQRRASDLRGVVGAVHPRRRPRRRLCGRSRRGTEARLRDAAASCCRTAIHAHGSGLGGARPRLARLLQPRSLRRRRARRAMNASGIVRFARWRSPLPGRTTSRRNHAEMPALAPAAPSAGRARFRSAGSRARRGARATKPNVPAPRRRQLPRRARRSPKIGPWAHRVQGSSTVDRDGRGGHDRGEARDPDQGRTRAGMRSEPPFQRGRERHRAATQRDEPRRHHVGIVRILRRQATDVLVSELVLVLATLGDQPGRGERDGPEQPAEGSQDAPGRHAGIVEAAVRVERRRPERAGSLDLQP